MALLCGRGAGGGITTGLTRALPRDEPHAARFILRTFGVVQAAGRGDVFHGR
jgi:hypothetical protein